VIIFVTEALTPVEFVSQRYNVFVKRKRESRLRGQVTNSSADQYGLLLEAAQSLAYQWATLLKCEVYYDEKAKTLLHLQPAGNGT
jgi:hypothetical protein